MVMDSNTINSSHAVHPSPPLARSQSSLLGPNSRMPHDEEMIRKIVREERARENHCKMSQHNLPPPRLLSDPKIPAQYQLQFMNQVKSTIFTTDQVRDVNGHPIKVAIYDMYTKPMSIISPDNILSSAKVKLILLNAEFCTNRVNWSPSEFVQNVLRARERKGPIVAGLIIQLVHGVGIFEKCVFFDNSSWTKCGFRLAAMVVCDGEEGYLNGERVQEAVSESFRVLDRRGKEFQKPDRLKLNDNVLRIKKIGKGRASCLKNKNITTVGDFLKWFYNDEPALLKLLGIKSKSNKEWECMVEHVTQCADEYKTECIASNNSSQPQQGLVDPIMERNMSLGTNVGRGVVDLESSEPEPNPSMNDINEGDVPATNKPYVDHVPDCCNPKMNFSYELVTNFSNEWETQMPMFHTNDGGFLQSKLSINPFLDNFSEWRADDALAPNYNESYLFDGDGGGGSDNYGGSDGGGGSGNYGGSGGRGGSSNYGGSGSGGG